MPACWHYPTSTRPAGQTGLGSTGPTRPAPDVRERRRASRSWSLIHHHRVGSSRAVNWRVSHGPARASVLHAPRVAAEPGPVRAELKLHGNARADADCEIDSKDPDPEAGSIVPALPVWPEAPRLHEDNQEGQAPGELGEQIVIDDGEREREAVNEKITHFACPLEHTGPPQASIGSTVRIRTAPSTS